MAGLQLSLPVDRWTEAELKDEAARLNAEAQWITANRDLYTQWIDIKKEILREYAGRSEAEARLGAVEIKHVQLVLDRINCDLAVINFQLTEVESEQCNRVLIAASYLNKVQ